MLNNQYCLSSGYRRETDTHRDGREADCARLKIGQGLTSLGGSNPSPAAN